MSSSTNDPGSEFVAREKSALAGLGDDFVAAAPPPQTNNEFVSINENEQEKEEEEPKRKKGAEEDEQENQRGEEEPRRKKGAEEEDEQENQRGEEEDEEEKEPRRKKGAEEDEEAEDEQENEREEEEEPRRKKRAEEEDEQENERGEEEDEEEEEPRRKKGAEEDEEAEDEQENEREEEEDEQEEEEELDEDEQEEEEELDEDECKDSPAYIPKQGRFYMHDEARARSVILQHTSLFAEEAEKGEEGQSTGGATQMDTAREPKTRADRVGRWKHDMFSEREQAPKSCREIFMRYGHDIRQPKGEETENEETEGQRGDRGRRIGQQRGFGGGRNATHNQPMTRDNQPTRDYPPLRDNQSTRGDQRMGRLVDEKGGWNQHDMYREQREQGPKSSRGNYMRYGQDSRPNGEEAEGQRGDRGRRIGQQRGFGGGRNATHNQPMTRDNQPMRGDQRMGRLVDEKGGWNQHDMYREQREQGPKSSRGNYMRYGQDNRPNVEETEGQRGDRGRRIGQQRGFGGGRNATHNQPMTRDNQPMRGDQRMGRLVDEKGGWNQHDMYREQREQGPKSSRGNYMRYGQDSRPNGEEAEGQRGDRGRRIGQQRGFGGGRNATHNQPMTRDNQPTRDYPPLRDNQPMRDNQPTRDYPPLRDNQSTRGDQRMGRLVDENSAAVPEDDVAPDGGDADNDDMGGFGRAHRTRAPSKFV
ncbi:hypothetical protein niasHT_007484 [Heterodera trifolii]|uniref:Protein CASC3 n=1 Tax=Heterodera trifolii TaxID=157864 RepID=A0ABD2LPA6_9BILA